MPSLTRVSKCVNPSDKAAFLLRLVHAWGTGCCRPPFATPGLRRAASAAIALLVALCGHPVHAAPLIPYELIPYEVVAEYPHHSNAFTQGLLIDGDTVIESSGLYGRSFLTRWRLGEERPLARVELPSRYFAEGLALVEKKLFLLTWREQRALIFDAQTLERTGSFRYRGEGWGLAYDGRRLIMSDGSDQLRLFDPAAYHRTGKISVRDHNGPVDELNELEWVPPDTVLTGAEGRLLANRWQTDTVVVIALPSGRVTGELRLSELFPAASRGRGVDVLNGIAFDPRDGTLLVTGKHWPKLYRLRLPEGLP